MRRMFVDAIPKGAKPSSGDPAMVGLNFCNELFKDEESLASQSDAFRQDYRAKVEKPLLEDFFAWTEKAAAQALPTGKLMQALTYARNQQTGLMNYLKDPGCVISNNLAENCIRPFTIGRKNWLFSGSPKGASASAAIYSIVSTARDNGLNAYKYLEYLLDFLPAVDFKNHPELLGSFLPWNDETQVRCKNG